MTPLAQSIAKEHALQVCRYIFELSDKGKQSNAEVVQACLVLTFGCLEVTGKCFAEVLDQQCDLRC